MSESLHERHFSRFSCIAGMLSVRGFSAGASDPAGACSARALRNLVARRRPRLYRAVFFAAARFFVGALLFGLVSLFFAVLFFALS